MYFLSLYANCLLTAWNDQDDTINPAITFDINIEDTILPGFVGTVHAGDSSASPIPQSLVALPIIESNLHNSSPKASTLDEEDAGNMDRCFSPTPVAPIATKRTKQTLLVFKKLSRAEWLDHECQRNLKQKETESDMLEQEALAEERKVTQKREAARIKKQHQ